MYTEEIITPTFWIQSRQTDRKRKKKKKWNEFPQGNKFMEFFFFAYSRDASEENIIEQKT